MSQKYLGGYLADTTTFTSTVAGDPQFNYVTMLLHGDGTNAAQNNTFLDSSSTANTITRSGNTTQGSFSPYGTLWSNYFNGSSAYLNWTGANCNGGTWTLEAWVCPTANGGGSYGGRGIICCGDVYLNMGFDSANKITLRWYTGSAGYSISSTTVLTLNTWYHVAVTFQSGTAAKVFVNGVLETSTTSNVTIGSATDWYIGREGAQASYFPGYISNARVSSSILYSATFTPSTTPLTVGATTNTLTCQSNRFIDNSTNAYTLTITAATVQRFSPFNATAVYSTSTIGGSGYFDGTGDYLNTPSTGQFAPAGDFTISCWYYATALGTYNALVGNYTSNASTDWIIDILANGTIRWYTNGATLRISSSAGAIITGTWNYLAMSRSGTTITAYLNGVSVGTYTQSGTFGSSTKTIYVGTQAGTELITGYLSDVKLIDGSAVTTVPTAPQTATTGTSLLLNFTNGAIYDNAAMSDLETVGNAQISTSVYKYGTGSMYFDGSGDQLTRASSPLYSFGTGDFTVEMWVNTSSTANMCLIDTRPTGAAEPWAIYTTATTSYPYFYDGSSRTSSIALTLNTWVHVAVCRASGTLRIFVNGVQGYSAANTTNLTSGAVQIGGAFSGAYLTGYIDDLRITNGYARYTTTFTPPTAAFPNAGTVTTTTSIVPTATAAPGIWTMEQQGYYKARGLWPV